MTINIQESELNQPVTSLAGVGKQIAKHLARLDIYSLRDILFHLPFRYQDRTQILPLSQVKIGNEVVIEGIIQQVQMPARGRTKLLCELTDDTGKLTLRFFHVLTFQLNKLKVGTTLRCYGEIKLGNTGLEIIHPEFKVIEDNKSIPLDPYLTPTYPATEGLNQYTLRKITSNALQILKRAELSEILPPSFLREVTWPSFKEALLSLHQPSRDTAMQELAESKTLAHKRLIFEELLTHRLSLLQMKQAFKAELAIAFQKENSLINRFLNALPFTLTSAQQRVVNEIEQDLQKATPMLRLVQGDVGSGKTVVAACAMLKAVQEGYQAALMAPTELLAEQHYRNFTRWFESLGIKIVFLSGSVKGSARQAALQAIASGEAQIILGTHALFEQQVEFSNLALIVVDEQHRFGVQQRALFRRKGEKGYYHPHQLIMTATPIPRTLAMSIYADLDSSVIDELPPGRTPITTSVFPDSRREEIIERIKLACEQGKQAYWVCALIEESEVVDCEAATTKYEYLSQRLPKLKIGLIHGRMKAQEKEDAMRAFQQGETHLLVATTVIEVGVDVPNASLMIIENAERLGLSQLHQLRGRVGRGSVASHCVLLYHHLSRLAKERLSVMRETTDGFKIAQCDLELRGPGEVLGTKQTGELSFRIADLLRDKDLLNLVQKVADMLIDSPQAIAILMQRWLGEKQSYIKV